MYSQAGNRWRCLIIVTVIAVLVIPLCHANAKAEPDSGMAVGKSIYQKGMIHPGMPLSATRADGSRIEGVDAACVNCHQRSGLGSTEGRITVPPITGEYLFFNPTHPSEADLDLAFVDGMRLYRPPYTDKTLAHAIRDGIGADGKPLNYMMPHFELGDKEVSSLIAYLKNLDHRPTRGVTHTLLHFATIITPDADPVKRKGMLAVLNRFFTDKNMAPVNATPRLRATHKVRFMVNPQWQLHVWQLKGPADTWKTQLENDLAREPVFAVVSGLGGKNWAPVQAFCEEKKLPCLFPNVEVPPAAAEQDFYSMYFSRGVLLEASMIANRVMQARDGKPVKSVRQIYRAGDSGVAAARTLTALLQNQGIKVENIRLQAKPVSQDIDKAAHPKRDVDAEVIWLRPKDIKTLGKPPAGSTAVYMSGLMGGLEHAPLPAEWRTRTYMAYPFNLPIKRRINVDFAFGWFRLRHVPVVAEQVQADTYLACSILAGTLHRMVDTFIPEYLIERIQGMLDNRLITGYYPHLTLATGQRFASKGGYIVRFHDAQGSQLTAASDWLVP